MSEHIYKSHNKTLLLYHLVFPVKYRRCILGKDVSNTLRDICLEISERYEVHFVEIGMEEDHVHFLIQSIPALSVTKIVTQLKSIMAKELYKRHPEIRKILWGGNIWTSVYYANTVGAYGDEAKIQNYVANQGQYEQILAQPLKFDFQINF